MGFCDDAQLQEFFRTTPDLENMLIRSGIILVKYWFRRGSAVGGGGGVGGVGGGAGPAKAAHGRQTLPDPLPAVYSVSDDEQERRFKDRIDDASKRWKLSPMDLYARSRWVEYAKAKDDMFKHTDTKLSPWWVVPSDDKKAAQLNCLAHLLSRVDYGDVPCEAITLPPRQAREDRGVGMGRCGETGANSGAGRGGEVAWAVAAGDAPPAHTHTLAPAPSLSLPGGHGLRAPTARDPGVCARGLQAQGSQARRVMRRGGVIGGGAGGGQPRARCRSAAAGVTAPRRSLECDGTAPPPRCDGSAPPRRV